MDQTQEHLDKALDDMLMKIEIERVRPMQRKMHLKLADCYNSKSTDSEEIDRCCQKYIAPAEAANNILDYEISRMQNRIERCSAVCNDQVQDKYPNATSTHSQAESMLQKCFASCADKHFDFMKSVKASIEKQLDDINSRN